MIHQLSFPPLWNFFLSDLLKPSMRPITIQKVSVPFTDGEVKEHGQKILDYIGLIINYLRKRRAGGTRQGLDGYLYLKHLIQQWPGDWVMNMAKMNKAVCMKTRVTTNGGGKRQVKNVKRQEFWKCIGFILSVFTYGKKGHKLWSEVPKYFGKYENT